MSPDFFQLLRDKLFAYAAQANTHCTVLYTGAALGAHARVAAPTMTVDTSPESLLVDRDYLALAAASAIGAGNLKLATPAYEKSARQPLALFDFRAGSPPSAAADAGLLGVAVTIDLRNFPVQMRAN
jgi:hypothetical protein